MNRIETTTTTTTRERFFLSGEDTFSVKERNRSGLDRARRRRDAPTPSEGKRGLVFYARLLGDDARARAGSGGARFKSESLHSAARRASASFALSSPFSLKKKCPSLDVALISRWFTNPRSRRRKLCAFFPEAAAATAPTTRAAHVARTRPAARSACPRRHSARSAFARDRRERSISPGARTRRRHPRLRPLRRHIVFGTAFPRSGSSAVEPPFLPRCRPPWTRSSPSCARR